MPAMQNEWDKFSKSIGGKVDKLKESKVLDFYIISGNN
jgi:hypothetical protein